MATEAARLALSPIQAFLRGFCPTLAASKRRHNVA